MDGLRPTGDRWWGDPEGGTSASSATLIEGRDTTRPFLFLVDGRPVGYIQYWFIGHHQNEVWVKDNPWLMALPSDANRRRLSRSGRPEDLSKGYGSLALKAFVAMLRSEGFENIIIDPDPNKWPRQCAPMKRPASGRSPNSEGGKRAKTCCLMRFADDRGHPQGTWRLNGGLFFPAAKDGEPMIRLETLDRAVASGLISDDQRQGLVTLEGGGDAVEPDDERDVRNLRLIGGGNDLFVTVGIVLLTAGFYFALSTLMAGETLWIAGLVAGFAWLVANS